MIISDLNYIETADQDIQGGWYYLASDAGSHTGAAGYGIYSDSSAYTSASVSWYGKSTAASTYGYASAYFGIVSSSSGAGSVIY